ncbi:MAG TPA: hypothetical protein PLZ67_08395, partial [Bacteroidales bacterium]|nr:hypothetical protein [Bacteroidales bacterium]
MLNKKQDMSGIASHHGHSGANFTCSVTGIKNCNRYFAVDFKSIGSFYEDGKYEDSKITGESSSLVSREGNNGCYTEWEKSEAFKILFLEISSCGGTVNTMDKGDGEWYGTDGTYSRKTVDEEGFGSSSAAEYTEETVQLMKIDTASMFSYLRERPSLKTFSCQGSYTKTYIIDQKKIVKRISYTATVTLGKKPGFTIEAENKEDYEKWLPGNQEYAESFKPISFKASFEDKQQKDSISFELYKISHLPGICTNYPILGDKPPKEEPDIYFAPQDKQTDENIRILNDSEAVTTKKVNEAVIVVYSRDFGGHANIKAMSFSAGETAVCPYDEVYRIEVPNDQDGNHIADDWEKQLGVVGIDKQVDKDKLPTGQNREGDGLTAFEEYRGFISEKDVIAACDGDHTKRTGKHVRTSPICRDVFIYDADGLFAKYAAASNPAECHWHYLSKDQVNLPPVDQVSAVIKANASDGAGGGDAAAGYVKTWIEKEFRCINKNSPDTLRNNRQYALYLLTSPFAADYGGNTIFYGDPANSSPLRYGHLVVLPQFDSFRKVQQGAVEGLIKNSKHNLTEKHPPDVIAKLMQTVFEAMVVHEIGHGLGINHHKNGVITVINTKTKEKLVLSSANLSAIKDGVQYNEVFYLDGSEYLITRPEFALNAMGVTGCCMRYTMEREVDFIDMKVLQKSLQYCKKGQKFINGDGKETEADDCFGSIKIRCLP